ncbi:MAG: enoyl-CoA hydratase/isomerase family protein [Chloroflexi bacterium]|nr:enoyl-CoA hydratase/isomerase family protein [Chloroflexota bacterium]
MADKELVYEKEGNLAIITLNRPQMMNAWTNEMFSEMNDAFEDAARDAKVGAVILTGAGDRAFSSGADVRAMAASGTVEGRRGPPPSSEGRPSGQLLNSILLFNFPKPTFAAVNGIAAGGGLCLAVKCDFRIASDKARFVSSYVSRGLVNGDGSSWFLIRVLGESKAMALMLTGDIIDAQEALRIGLVNKVVPHEKLMEATKEMAGKIAKGPPIAQSLIKREVHRAALSMQSLEMQHEFESYCQSQGSPEERKEGFGSFLERREPHFPGR